MTKSCGLFIFFGRIIKKASTVLCNSQSGRNLILHQLETCQYKTCSIRSKGFFPEQYAIHQINLASVLPTVTPMTTFTHLISVGLLTGVKLSMCNTVFRVSDHIVLENTQLCSYIYVEENLKIYLKVKLNLKIRQNMFCVLLFPLLLLLKVLILISIDYLRLVPNTILPFKI